MLEPYPRLPVTDQGVFVPKTWFGDATEVALSKETNGQIVLKPVIPCPESTNSLSDSGQESVWDLGSDPITDDPIADGSVNLDKYLYGAP